MVTFQEYEQQVAERRKSIEEAQARLAQPLTIPTPQLLKNGGIQNQLSRQKQIESIKQGYSQDIQKALKEQQQYEQEVSTTRAEIRRQELIKGAYEDAFRDAQTGYSSLRGELPADYVKAYKEASEIAFKNVEAQRYQAYKSAGFKPVIAGGKITGFESIKTGFSFSPDQVKNLNIQPISSQQPIQSVDLKKLIESKYVLTPEIRATSSLYQPVTKIPTTYKSYDVQQQISNFYIPSGTKADVETYKGLGYSSAEAKKLAQAQTMYQMSFTPESQKGYLYSITEPSQIQKFSQKALGGITTQTEKVGKEYEKLKDIYNVQYGKYLEPTTIKIEERLIPSVNIGYRSISPLSTFGKEVSGLRLIRKDIEKEGLGQTWGSAAKLETSKALIKILPETRAETAEKGIILVSSVGSASTVGKLASKIPKTVQYGADIYFGATETPKLFDTSITKSERLKSGLVAGLSVLSLGSSTYRGARGFFKDDLIIEKIPSKLKERSFNAFVIPKVEDEGTFFYTAIKGREVITPEKAIVQTRWEKLLKKPTREIILTPGRVTETITPYPLKITEEGVLKGIKYDSKARPPFFLSKSEPIPSKIKRSYQDVIVLKSEPRLYQRSAEELQALAEAKVGRPVPKGMAENILGKDIEGREVAEAYEETINFGRINPRTGKISFKPGKKRMFEVIAETIPEKRKIGEDIILYTGTTTTSANKILQEGLLPASKLGKGELGEVYLTTSKEVAKGFATRKVYGSGKIIPGEKPVVLEVAIPKNKFPDLFVKRGTGIGGFEEITLKKVPAQYVRDPFKIGITTKPPVELEDIDFYKSKVLTRELGKVGGRGARDWQLTTGKITVTPVQGEAGIDFITTAGTTSQIIKPSDKVLKTIQVQAGKMVPPTIKTIKTPEAKSILAQSKTARKLRLGTTVLLGKGYPTYVGGTDIGETASTSFLATGPQVSRVDVGQEYITIPKQFKVDRTDDMFNVKTKIDTGLRTSTFISERERTEFRTPVLELERTDSMFKITPLLKPSEGVRLLPRLAFREAQLNKLKFNTPTKQVFRPRIPTPTVPRKPTPRIKPPKIKPPKLPGSTTKQIFKPTSRAKDGIAYVPEVRRKGKFFAVGGPTTKGRALLLGATRVKETLAATFRIKPVKVRVAPREQDISYVPSKEVFRRPKSLKESQFTFVQKTGMAEGGISTGRLTTIGEKTEIKASRQRYLR